MIRTTAEASNTKRGAFNEATSTLPVLANQRFRRWLKCSTITLCRHSGQIDKSLSTPLTRIATTGLLQIHQGLERVARRSASPLSTDAHQSAQNPVTPMGLRETMGHAEVQVMQALAAVADHPAAAIAA
jgi:hypothetical protein